MVVPDRPKGIQPRAWAVATAHLKDSKEVPLPLPPTKVDVPVAKDFLPKELNCEECGESPKDCECDDCDCEAVNRA